jgi:DNA-binding response OmpR family regulator
VETILVVDDEPAMLRLLQAHLSESYKVLATGDPEQVLGLALKHKPAAILLDLMMPKYSGFELCQCLHSLSYTSRIPLFVVTGESAERYKTHCESLGAREFIEKPVNFGLLTAKLAAEIQREKPERRAHVRVSLRVIVTLRGSGEDSAEFEAVTMTENISAGGFLCLCPKNLVTGSTVELFLGAGEEHFVGRAEVMRKESPLTPWQRYAFRFLEKTNRWVFEPTAGRLLGQSN